MPTLPTSKSARSLASSTTVSTSPFASKGLTYLVINDDPTLSGGRVLEVGEGLTSTDNGAGETFELAIDEASSTTLGGVRLAGDLGGDDAAAPEVVALHEGGGTRLEFGEIPDTYILKRSGDTIIGVEDPAIDLTSHLEATADVHSQYILKSNYTDEGGYARLGENGRVSAANAPFKSVYATGGNQALTPADIGALPGAGGTLSGHLDMASHRVQNLSDGVAPTDAVNLGQLTAVINGLDWQASVLRQDLNAAPGSPVAGDRYLVAAGVAGGDPWAGQEGKIAQYGGSAWTFIAPTKGTTLHVEGGTGGGVDMHYTGTAWVNLGASVDHGALLGLTTGDPHTQYQLRSERNAANGFCGLDATGRVGTSQAPPKATYATGGAQALTPADIGAPATSRLVQTGTGLSGGGDLTADRTLGIAAFTGGLSKDVDPPSQTYNAGVTGFGTWDAGSHGQLLPVAVRLPATTHPDLRTELVIGLDDGSSVVLSNADPANFMDLDFVALSMAVLGSLSGSAANNGRKVKALGVQVLNVAGTLVADVGTFRVRAVGMPRGGGAAL